MGKQLALFDTKEIPKELKELLCGNGENDFALGVQMAIPFGFSAFDCLKISLTNINLDIPDSDFWIHLQVPYYNITFYVFEHDSDTFTLVAKRKNEPNCFEIFLAEWDMDDECYNMQNKLKSKIKQVLFEYHSEFKQFLQT